MKLVDPGVEGVRTSRRAPIDGSGTVHQQGPQVLTAALGDPHQSGTLATSVVSGASAAGPSHPPVAWGARSQVQDPQNTPNAWKTMQIDGDNGSRPASDLRHGSLERTHAPGTGGLRQRDGGDVRYGDGHCSAERGDGPSPAALAFVLDGAGLPGLAPGVAAATHAPCVRPLEASGLDVGDEFRLLFANSGAHSATSSRIGPRTPTVPGGHCPASPLAARSWRRDGIRSAGRGRLQRSAAQRPASEEGGRDRSCDRGRLQPALRSPVAAPGRSCRHGGRTRPSH